MTRIARLFPLLALALGCFTAAVARADSPAPESAAVKPNIVFILVDDMGWADTGCYGSHYYRTPNIDKLATQGERFTACYMCPNCTPSRAALMSGEYAPRTGVYTVASSVRGEAKFRKLVPVKNNRTLEPHFVTIAETLKKAGYATGMFGKWHLGKPGVAGPQEQGFDVNVGGNQTGMPAGTYFSPYHNPQIPDGPKGEYLTDRLTTEAIKFIDAHKDGPFFVYLPHYAVHTPLQAKSDLVALYEKVKPFGGQHNPVYAAMIDSVDQSVGRIMDELDRLHLAQNTILIFASDNGGVGGYGEIGGNFTGDITSNSPLRGGKGMLYEGGIRDPLIVRWPGVTRAGSICDEPVVNVDFYPTLMDAAGAPAPAPGDQPLDGVDIGPVLRDPAGHLGRDAIYWHFPVYLQANVKKGTWRTTPAGAIRSGDWKLIEFFEDKHVELYNLKNDLGEKHDLAAEMPEKARELRRKLAEWRERIHAPMPRRVAGHSHASAR